MISPAASGFGYIGAKEPPNITHLILDQFEEVFTLGAERTGAENEVRDALAILLQCSIPDPIVQLIAEHDEFSRLFRPRFYSASAFCSLFVMTMSMP